VIEVELVEHDQAGFVLVLNDARDFAILGGYTFGTVNNEKANVGATY